MYCANCGKAMGSGEVYCTNCGRNVSPPPDGYVNTGGYPLTADDNVYRLKRNKRGESLIASGSLGIVASVIYILLIMCFVKIFSQYSGSAGNIFLGVYIVFLWVVEIVFMMIFQTLQTVFTVRGWSLKGEKKGQKIFSVSVLLLSYVLGMLCFALSVNF